MDDRFRLIFDAKSLIQFSLIQL